MTRAVVVFRDAALERDRLEREAAEQRALAEEQRNKTAEERARNEEERRKNAEVQEQAAQEQATVIGNLAEGLQKLSEGDLVFRLDEASFGSYRQISQDFNRMAERVAASMSVIATSTREVTNSATEISRGHDRPVATHRGAGGEPRADLGLDGGDLRDRQGERGERPARQRARRPTPARSRAAAARSWRRRSMRCRGSRSSSQQDRRHHQRDRRDRAADQPAGAQRRGGGGARRRAGRGFAVVASEVRSLAQRSSQAAKDIKDLITNSRQPGPGGRRTGQPRGRVARRDRRLDQERGRHRLRHRRASAEQAERHRPGQQGADPDGRGHAAELGAGRGERGDREVAGAAGRGHERAGRHVQARRQ